MDDRPTGVPTAVPVGAPADAPAPDGRAALARLADELLPALIARLSVSDLGELEVREGDWRVRLRRDGPRHEVAAPGTGTTSGTRRSAAESASTDQAQDGTRTATSPAVGYFAPRPDVAAGSTVRAGDVIGAVEVLGVRQDVIAPSDGVVGRVLAAAGEAVEYGQALVLIDAEAAGSD